MLKSFIAFLGRLCISLIFLAAGIKKVIDWEGTEHEVSQSLINWLSIGFGVEWIQKLVETAIPLVPALVIVALLCELIGGLCILLGIQVRFGAALLILFLIPTTLLMHHFWTLQGPERELQLTMFIKNVSIFGGLLILLAYGKGEKGSSKKKHDSEK